MPNIRTVSMMTQTIAENIWQLDREAYDVIVGVPRSGIMPASIIATFLQLPFATVEGYRAGIIHGRSNSRAGAGKRILLVDDSCNKGGAMARAVATIGNRARITRLAVYAPYQVENPAALVDITFAECRGPRIFAWNMWKHKRLPRWAFDMDGVLCRDPVKGENDDGRAYLNFIANAEPMFLPLRPIGHIVTSRLEKYRSQTEDWLERHGVIYSSLTMMNLPDKRARMTAMKVDGGRGGWKARQVDALRSDGHTVEMFIESCPKQARIIAREAGIPAFCTRTQEVFDREQA